LRFRYHAAIDLVLFDDRLGYFMQSKVMLELTVGDGALSYLREQLLPTPRDQQRDYEIDDEEPPFRPLSVYFGWFLDWQRYPRLLFH
jgi:hypothetical protein